MLGKERIRLRTCARADCILLEWWSGRHVDVSHLRVFGSTAWVKLPIDKNGRQVNGGSKLDDRTVKGCLVGYMPGHGGYRILLDDGRIVRSKDVVFEEG